MHCRPFRDGITRDLNLPFNQQVLAGYLARTYDVSLKVMRRSKEGMGGEYSVCTAFGETKKVESFLRGSEGGP